jgi:hypothetical protein
MAGTQSRAIELSTEIDQTLRQRSSPIGQDYVAPNWAEILKDAVLKQKHRIANEMVAGRFGITYDQLIKIGNQKFPPDVYRDIISEISRTSLDCWLLVIAFSQTDPRIFRINASGMVERCTNFAAIGTGIYLAESALFQRSHRSTNDLGTTIYNVFEAMRVGSNAPGVGDQFEIAIVEWDYWEESATNEGNIKWSFLSLPYYELLERKFKRFGPQPTGIVRIRPRLIQERQRAIVLTPKGAADPEHIAASKRAKAAREREARKRHIKQQLALGTSKGQQ